MQTVLVLQGGNSAEREVSLRSAANVAGRLEKLGYTVLLADPAEPAFNLEKAVADCDVVLPVLHGAGGEDGVLQRQLETLGKPFLGAGSAACELTFDKMAFRECMATHGIRMARGEVVGQKEFKTSELSEAPYVLKPIAGGSSIDTLLVHDLKNEPTPDHLAELFSKYDEMLLEELIVGHELTVGVLGDEALPVILIVPPTGEEFDYENKYNGRTQEIVNPAEVAAEVQKRAQELALQLHRLTGCRHLSRSDMIATPSGDLYVLETNTIPGLTEQSLLPKAAAAAGISMTELCDRLVTMAAV